MATTTDEFDPDAFLKQTDSFDPDEFLKKTAPTPVPVTGSEGKGIEIATAYGQEQGAPTIEEQKTMLAAVPEGVKAPLEAAAETVSGFIPKTALQVAEFATPAVGAVETVAQIPRTLSDIFSGKPMSEIFPPDTRFSEAEKTPPFSKERYAAGFQTIGEIGMAAAIGRGMAPNLRAAFDPLFGKSEPISPTPLSDAATTTAKEITDASKITIPEGVTQPEIRTQVGEGTSLRQPGEITQAREEAQGGGPPAAPIGGAAEQIIPKTADEAQTRVDAIEDRLVAQGDDISKFYNPTSPEVIGDPATIKSMEKEGWKPMPPDLVEAYRVRNELGSGELHKSVSDMVTKLKSDTGLSDAEIAQVLDNYSIKPGKTDVLAQYMAAEHAVPLAKEPLERQAERAAYALADERGEMFDELRDISPKTLRDAAKAVQSVREFFGAETKTPKLLPNEIQGDMISSTQSEPLKLVGEDFVDHEARALEEQAKVEERAQSEKGQTTFEDLGEKLSKEEEAKMQAMKSEYESGVLEDVQAYQERGGQEILEAIKQLGGLREDSPHLGFLREAFLQKSKHATQASARSVVGDVRYGDVFKKNAAGDDALVRELQSRGFDVEDPGHLADILDRRFKGGKEVFGIEARAQESGITGLADWTSATAEGGFIGSTSGTFKAIAIKKRTPLDAATGQRSERLQKSFTEAERAQKEIRKVAPTDRRQNAISVWMEAGGDRATIDQWASAAKGKMFKQAAEDAKNLSPQEIAIAQKARATFDILENRGNKFDVLSSHRDNYVPHIWQIEKKFTGVGSSRLQDKFKFNKARTFENFFEGDQAGFKPKTMAIGKVLPAYLHEMNKVIADRQFVQDVAHMTAKDKRPLVVPRGNAKTVDTTDYVVRDANGQPLPRFQKSVYETQAEAQAALKPGQTIERRPSSSALVNPRGFAKAEDAKGNPVEQGDYKILDQPALNNWRWIESDPQGNTTILKSDLAVHPELAKRLNAMTGQSAIRQWYNEPSTGFSVIPKAIAKGLDVGQAVMKREMLGLLAPFHQVQEATHAIGHTVNPFFNIPNMERLTPESADAVRHGLMLLPERTPSQSYIEGVGGKGTFVTQLSRWLGEKVGDNLAGKAIRGVGNVIDGYQDFLFHKYIPGLKMKTYDHILSRNMDRYATELKRGEVTESDVKSLSATQTDAAYGHLNYAQLDRNPTMQHILQLGLLAPDFLEARGRFVGQSLKVLAGEKAGAEQFRAVAVLAATQAATMYTLAHVLGGEWDGKHPFEMTVKGRRYMLRSVPEDLHRLFFQGPDVRREFVSARINPATQKGVQLETGRNYRGEKTTSLETMGELLANYIPITARQLPGLRNLTETSRNDPVSPLERLAGSMGLKISRYSPITKTHQLASEWMKGKGLPADTGVYPVSKYQRLRYALEDADLPRAREEWTALSKGADRSKLIKGFHESINHPYTGSQKSDKEFRSSLSGSNRMIFDHANEVKRGILHKFQFIAGSAGSSRETKR